MIEVNTNLRRAKAFEKAHQTKPHFRTLTPSKILVMPREQGHRPTVVTFDSGERGAVFATCRYHESDEVCPANQKGRWCYHVAWATIQIVRQQNGVAA